jgi:hypothetical protein
LFSWVRLGRDIAVSALKGIFKQGKNHQGFIASGVKTAKEQMNSIFFVGMGSGEAKYAFHHAYNEATKNARQIIGLL